MIQTFKGIPAIQFPKDPGGPKTQLQMFQNCWKPLEITFSDWVNMIYKKIRPKTSSLLQNYSVHLDHNALYFHFLLHILKLKNRVSKILYPYLQAPQNCWETPEMEFSEWVDIFQKKIRNKNIYFSQS